MKENKGLKNQNNGKKNQDDIDDDIELSEKTAFVKKIFLILALLIFGGIIGLFMLQKAIKFDNKKIEINNELKSLIIEETGELNKNGSAILIKGGILFRSFLVPHIVINDVVGVNLTEGSYKMDFTIKQIRLSVSPLDLLKKKIVITKIDVLDGKFNLREADNLEFNVVQKIVKNIFEKATSQNPFIKFSLKNTNILIEAKEFNREFANIDIDSTYTANKLNISGKLTSNKQPLNIGASFDKNKNNFDGDVKLSSQAFDGNISLKMDLNSFQSSGKANFNIINTQIFTRTIFNSSNFLYRRIIDNGNLKLDFDFSFENKIFSAKNINLDGRSVRGKGEINLNFNENKENNVEFDIDAINLDSLMIKNIAGKNIDNRDHMSISIFSGQEPKPEDSLKYKSFLEQLININPTYFDIKIKNLRFNQEDILNSEFNFSYGEKEFFHFNKITGELPGKTVLKIEKANDNELISIKGEDLDKFLGFLKNSNNSAPLNSSINEESIKKQFNFEGEIKAIGNKLFINNANYSTANFNSKNQIEIEFNSGISYIAVNSIIDDLLLDNFININETNDLNNTFKNKMLFLNNFNLQTFLKFNIKNIQYKDLKDKNYNFIIKTSSGLLNIYNIDLNGKIKGNATFDIISLKPNININLNIQNLDVKNNINVNDIIFWLPTFEGFYGNIVVKGNNINFKQSNISSMEILSKLNNGVLYLDKFQINGFGGKCSIEGYLMLQYNKRLNIKFAGCTADLKDTLYLFTGIQNISGLIGFSSFLYAEGSNMEQFIKSYLTKIQLIGTGITVKNFGLFDLSSILFEINSNEELLKDLNPEKIVYNEESQTVFDKLSGNINYSKKNNGQFNFDISRPMINGKIAGTFDLFSNHINLKSNSTFIALSGTLEKTIPLTLLIGINGITPNNLNIATNFQQIDTYIQSIKEQFEEINRQIEEQKRIEEEQRAKEEEKDGETNEKMETLTDGN